MWSAGKGRLESGPMQIPDVSGGDNKNFAYALWQVVARPSQNASLDVNAIISLRRFDGERSHTQSFTMGAASKTYEAMVAEDPANPRVKRGGANL